MIFKKSAVQSIDINAQLGQKSSSIEIKSLSVNFNDQTFNC